MANWASGRDASTEPKAGPMGATGQHPGPRGSEAREDSQGQTPRPFMPGSRTFRGSAQAGRHLEYPALLSIQSHSDLGLKAVSSPQLRQSVLLGSLQPHQVSQGPQSEPGSLGGGGVSLTLHILSPDGGTTAQRGLEDSGLVSLSGRDRAKEAWAWCCIWTASQQPPRGGTGCDHPLCPLQYSPYPRHPEGPPAPAPYCGAL